MELKDKLHILIEYRNFLKNIFIPHFAECSKYNLETNITFNDIATLHTNFSNNITSNGYEDFNLDATQWFEDTLSYCCSIRLEDKKTDECFFYSAIRIYKNTFCGHCFPSVTSITNVFTQIAEEDIFNKIQFLLSSDKTIDVNNVATRIAELYYHHNSLKCGIYNLFAGGEITIKQLKTLFNLNNPLISFDVNKIKITCNIKILGDNISMSVDMPKTLDKSNIILPLYQILNFIDGCRNDLIRIELNNQLKTYYGLLIN